MNARWYVETLLVCAFMAGASLTSGYFIGEEPAGEFLRGVGWFFLFLFIGYAIVMVLQVRRGLRRMREYERAKKGFSWRS